MMNKTRFRLLVFFMSLSLIGIILVQLYWINSSLKNNNDQFKFHIQQLLTTVTGKLQEQEEYAFINNYRKIEESIGRSPILSDFISAKEGDRSNDASTAGNTGNKVAGNESTNAVSGTTSGKVIDTTGADDSNDLEFKDKLRAEFLFNSYVASKPIEERLSADRLRKILKAELKQSEVDIPFEFAVYDNGVATKIKSANFKYNDGTHQHPLFTDRKGISRYRLLLSFPEKEAFIFSSLLGITSLSLVFTLIIIIAYLSAINQLIKQKQISEIKSDFINNMTHEFKTPIATINLALDAIKNPRIFDDKEKVQRYLQMIKDENKRMHAQVENVLQISKLDKKELDIAKEQADIHNVIETAIEHVHLIIEARQGTLTRHFAAQRTTTLLNDVHFTNVLVNILDNAIKYSPDAPVIDIYTENVKDFILIKIEDKGLGMSKVTLKRIFEKFYREHTGDVHNVKGHGLGLAYVKRIIDDHNCNIYVESEKGKGSTFIIKMPLIN
jgi:two-component system phosphate regulon sensor histidine kinase PhoR